MGYASHSDNDHAGAQSFPDAFPSWDNKYGVKILYGIES